MNPKVNELRNMTVEELHHKGISLKEELLKLRLQRSTGRLEKPARMRSAIKTLAQIETVLKEKSLNETKKD